MHIIHLLAFELSILLGHVLTFYTACPGAPETPTIISSIPPKATLSWAPPSDTGDWTIVYQVSWPNGTIIVPRQAGTTTQIPGLQAETQYSVVITAFTVSNLCPGQSTAFTFMTSQS